MNKKSILLISTIIGLLTIINSVYAVNYVLSVSSVDEGEIRWGGSTKYSSQLTSAIATWNNYGDINIAPDTASTYEDVTISDVYLSDVAWGGAYSPSVGSDNIQYNKYYLDGNSSLGTFTSNEKQKTIGHELGHALGLDHHNISGNILRSGKYSTIVLGSQDVADYDYLWN